MFSYPANRFWFWFLIVVLFLNLGQNTIRLFFGNYLYFGTYVTFAFSMIIFFGQPNFANRRIGYIPYIIIFLFIYFIFYLYVGFIQFGSIAIQAGVGYFKFPVFFFVFYFISAHSKLTESDLLNALNIVLLLLFFGIVFSANPDYWIFAIENNPSTGDEIKHGQYLALGFFPRLFAFDLSPVDTGFCSSTLAAYFYFSKGKRFSFHFFLATIILLASFNRTAMIGLMVVLFFWGTVRHRLFAAIAVLSFLFILGFLDRDFFDKVIEMFQFSDASSLQRINISLPKAIDILSYNILGHGIGASHPLRKDSFYVENNYFNILIDLGIIGFVLFFMFMICYIYWCFLNGLNNHLSGCVAVLTQSFIFSIPLVPFNSNSYATVLMFIVAANYYLIKNSNPEKTHQKTNKQTRTGLFY